MVKLTLSPHKIIYLGCLYVLVVALLAIQTNKHISDELADDDLVFGLIDNKLEWKRTSLATRERSNKQISKDDNDDDDASSAYNDLSTMHSRDVGHPALRKGKTSGLPGPPALVIRGQQQLPTDQSEPKDLVKGGSKGPPRGFGLCLLIKDDNDILPEWIAYHYHALELRRLIVAVDPSSNSLPNPILERFQTELPDLSVEIWNDEDYMPSYFLEGNYSRIPSFIGNANATHSEWHTSSSEHFQNESTAETWLTSINNHRYRQVQFVGECIRKLHSGESLPSSSLDNQKQQAARPPVVQWMAHIDTDEFIVINPKLFTKDQDRYATIKLNKTMARPNEEGRRPWDTMAASSVLEFLDEWLVRYPVDLRACVQIPRLLFGAKEKEGSGNKDTSAHDGISPFDSLHFETLRWNWHAPFGGNSANGHPKVLLDLTQLDVKKDRILEPHRRAVSVHRLSFHLCPEVKDFKMLWDTRPVISNHYLGSAERYLGKGDPRRSVASHDKKSQQAAFKHADSKSVDWLHQWIPRMVADHGLEKMQRLLPEYLEDPIDANKATWT